MLAKCAGSVMMQKAHPELTTDESEAARQGTAAHWVVEQMLKECINHNKETLLGLSDLPATAPNGETINDMMIEAAQDYVKLVMSIVGDKLYCMRVEEKVDVKRIHELCYGFVDTSICLMSTNPQVEDHHLYILDFKYGFTPVEAYENWQLMSYAAGKIDTLGLDDLTTTLHLIVHQPRRHHILGPVREWTIKGHEIRAYMNHIKHQAEMSLKPEAETVSGDHCKHCTARRGCPAAINAGYNAIDVIDKAIPIHLSNDELGVVIQEFERAVEAGKTILSGLEAEAMARIEQGNHIHLYSIGSGRSSTNWKEGSEELIINMGKLLGHDIAKPIKPITPKQAINKGIDANVIKPYIVEKAGKAKLVKTDDSLAVRIFKPRGK